MDCPHFPPNVWPKEYIDKPTLFKTVTLPADFGDDEANPPKVGAYRNVILNYLANNHTYIYSSDGIPVLLTVAGGSGTFNFDELTGRPSYNGATMTSNTDIPEVPHVISDEDFNALWEGV